MIRFIKYATDGRIAEVGICADGDLYLQATPGLTVLAHPTATLYTHKVIDGEVVEYSEAGKLRAAELPKPGFRWDTTLEDWVDERSLAEIKAELLTRLRTKRDELLEGGFVWDGSPFDSDTAVSQPRILGLFTTAIAGGIPPEGYPWRLADNTWRVLSAADATAVWGAFQAHMAGLFGAFAVHEATVAAETDVAVLRAYDVEAGWP